jgi:hypothetical protein
LVRGHPNDFKEINMKSAQQVSGWIEQLEYRRLRSTSLPSSDGVAMPVVESSQLSVPLVPPEQFARKDRNDGGGDSGGSDAPGGGMIDGGICQGG